MWTMNLDGIAGAWKRFRSKLKERLGNVAGNDSVTKAEKRDRFAEVLQHDYDAAKAQSKKRFGTGASVLIPVPISTSPKRVPGDRR
jgi:uncharacterized protein YjbJ (UPF0337 family)